MLVRQFDPTLGISHDWRGVAGIGYVANYVWDVGSLTWVPSTSGSGGVAANVAVTNWPSFATETTLAKIPGLGVPQHDAVSQSQDATHDVWSFYTGGLAGTLVATVTITYTDGTKTTITSVVKS